MADDVDLSRRSAAVQIAGGRADHAPDVRWGVKDAPVDKGQGADPHPDELLGDRRPDAADPDHRDIELLEQVMDCSQRVALPIIESRKVR